MSRCRKGTEEGRRHLFQEEREPALEQGSAGAHEDSHPLPLLVSSLQQRGGGMIPTGQEEEREDQRIILTSQIEYGFFKAMVT